MIRKNAKQQGRHLLIFRGGFRPALETLEPTQNVAVEYAPSAGIAIELTENPMKDLQHPLSRVQMMQHPNGLLPRSGQREPEASSPFRRRQDHDATGPLALTPGEHARV